MIEKCIVNVHVFTCMCAFANGGVSSMSGLFQLLTTLFSEIGSSPEPRAHWLARLNENSFKRSICLAPPVMDYRYMLPHLACTEVLKT